MPYQFKNNPSNADKFTLNGVTYIYNSAKGVWKDISVGTSPPVTSSDTAPANPSAGDLWYRTDDSTLYVYYNDGSSSQWVGVSGPSGPAGADGTDGTDGTDGSAQSYTNFAAFPSTGNTLGKLAVAQDTKALYMWDGTEWDRISSGSDESPRITTEPTTSHALNSDGTTSTVTMVAEDPEGFDIEYGISYNTSGGALPSQLASATTINQSTGVFTFTPTTNQANEGNFTARLSASDGARVTTRSVNFELAFDPLNEDFDGTANTNLVDYNSSWSINSLGAGGTTAVLDGNSNVYINLNGGYDAGIKRNVALTSGVAYTIEVDLAINNFSTNRFILVIAGSAKSEVNGTGIKTWQYTPPMTGNFEVLFRTVTTANSGNYSLGHFKVYET